MYRYEPYELQTQAQAQAEDQQIPVPGATTVGIVCQDGVILASEKRVTYGNFIISKGSKKVFKITGNIGIACAGLISDMQYFARQVTADSAIYGLDVGRKISVHATSKLMSKTLFDKHATPLLTQTIVAGVDDEGPSLYVLDPLGSVLPDDYATVGSGTEIAIAVIEEGWRKDSKVAEAKDLIARAIKSAVSRDALSGNGVDFMIITRKGINEETTQF
ncbi:MAG: proteasome subunit beta [Candidatus Bathyarchaeia archaeon]|jgi:proteasome beta subunit